VTRVLDIADPARGEEGGEFQGRLLGASVSVIVRLAQPATQAVEHLDHMITGSAGHVLLRVRRVGP
jgi:hypothetical protein